MPDFGDFTEYLYPHMKSNMFEKVVNDVSWDPRIKDGIFKIEENEHMEVLRDYFLKKGIAESCVREFCNSVVEGKYPERQAYNAKGILVTFPTPEYKAAAIKRGTHFEDDPTRKASNIFTSPSGAPAPEKPADDKGQGKTSLSMSSAGPATPSPEDQTAPAAPATTPEPPAPAATQAVAPQQPEKPVEPPKEPTELPPVPKKSPEEKAADMDAIKKILKGDEFMLEQLIAEIVEQKTSKVYLALFERLRRKPEL